MSGFTQTKIIQDETADPVREAIVEAVIEMQPATGSIVQVDPGPSLQLLANESENDSVLKKLNIKIELGRVHNKNKNPIAENAIKEFRKERLRLNPQGGSIT